MPSKLTMYKIENTIATAQTAGTTYSKPIRGKIISVKLVFTNSTPANSSDRDVNLWEMNPEDDDDVSDALQQVLDVGSLGASPSADNVVYYPRAPLQDYQGVALDLSDAQGGNNAVYGPFVVFGRLMLQVTAAAAGDITRAYVLVEEY